MFRGLWTASLLRRRLRHRCWQGTGSNCVQEVGVIKALQLEVLWTPGLPQLNLPQLAPRPLIARPIGQAPTKVKATM